MAEEITGANDVELVIEGVHKRGTASAMGRIVVDDFTMTREDGSELVSGVGFNQPAGIRSGDVTYGFDFTMIGDDKDTFETVSTQTGDGNIFSFTARRVLDDGTVDWEKSMSFAKATMEEESASTGDDFEYSVEGIAAQYERET